MCGIAGIVDHGGRQPIRAEDIQAMIAAISHRGPDGTGIWTGGSAGLGHARLSIIDQSGGAQPIGNEDGSIQVVLNGEIFNYIELRERLIARGHRFKTQSDTEVLVHLYEDYGDAMVEHLNGQFAFAIWDVLRERLLLARDRVGIRPLFYTQAAGRLAFASEIKALLTLPDMPRRINPRALAQVFTFWAPIAPDTMFESVHQLPAGHVLSCDSRGVQVTRYWDWQFEVDPVADNISAASTRPEALLELLDDAVRLQLRSDVPVGAYVSGGLDSALIAALASRYRSTPIRTFSMTFEDAEFDESLYQQQVIRQLGTEHSSMRVNAADIAMQFPKAVFHAETPVVRTAPVAMMMLSRHVREAGFKVVLTGEGADEIFGGYDLFKEARVRRSMANHPGSAWRASLLTRLYPWLKHSPGAGRALSAKFFHAEPQALSSPTFGHAIRWSTTSRAMQFFSDDLRDQIGSYDPVACFESTLPKAMPKWSALGRDQYVEAHTLLEGYLLAAQGDRMSLANAVEGRYPFLDHRVVEWGGRLPAAAKMRGLLEKRVLKQAATGLVPPSIVKRAKQPYRTPDSQCFFIDRRAPDYVEALLDESHLRATGLFDPIAVGRLVQKCRNGRSLGFGDNMAFVGILSTLLLEHQFVSRPAMAV